MHEIEFLINSLPIAIISINKDLTIQQYNNKALTYKNGSEIKNHSSLLFEVFPYLIFIKDTLYKSMDGSTNITEEDHF